MELVRKVVIPVDDNNTFFFIDAVGKHECVIVSNDKPTSRVIVPRITFSSPQEKELNVNAALSAAESTFESQQEVALITPRWSNNDYGVLVCAVSDVVNNRIGY
jgi:hypothetical protein